jgi:aryl-alcohol dehydrogenase-like predicted oxidoreductase
MRYTLLGKSGLRVSGLCLGTMTFDESLRWGASKEDSQKIYHAFMEAGGNFIDTHTYGPTEEYLGEFIAGDRERVVLATKFNGSIDPADVNSSGSHRKSMVRSVETSLRRLKTDYIDLLWVHAWDFMTPVEEVMRALDDLVRRGKVLYIGVSNAPAWIVSQANMLAELRGWTQFVALQVEYSLVEREVDRDLLPMAKALGISLVAWTPLASGWLTGKYNKNGSAATVEAKVAGPNRLDDPIMGRFLPRNERNVSIAEEVCKIAGEIGCTPAQVALNWVRHRGGIPLFGARKVEQVRENVACFEVPLSAEHIQRLNQVGKIKLGFPHDFLASGIVKNLMYGGRYDLIDQSRR